MSSVWVILKIVLPVVIVIGLILTWYFVRRAIAEPKQEEQIRWYAGITLAVMIVSIVAWIILLVPSPTGGLQ